MSRVEPATQTETQPQPQPQPQLETGDDVHIRLERVYWIARSKLQEFEANGHHPAYIVAQVRAEYDAAVDALLRCPCRRNQLTQMCAAKAVTTTPPNKAPRFQDPDYDDDCFPSTDFIPTDDRPPAAKPVVKKPAVAAKPAAAKPVEAKAAASSSVMAEPVERKADDGLRTEFEKLRTLRVAEKAAVAAKIKALVEENSAEVKARDEEKATQETAARDAAWKAKLKPTPKKRKTHVKRVGLFEVLTCDGCNTPVLDINTAYAKCKKCSAAVCDTCNPALVKLTRLENQHKVVGSPMFDNSAMCDFCRGRDIKYSHAVRWLMKGHRKGPFPTMDAVTVVMIEEKRMADTAVDSEEESDDMADTAVDSEEESDDSDKEGVEKVADNKKQRVK